MAKRERKQDRGRNRDAFITTFSAHGHESRTLSVGKINMAVPHYVINSSESSHDTSIEANLNKVPDNVCTKESLVKKKKNYEDVQDHNVEKLLCSVAVTMYMKHFVNLEQYPLRHFFKSVFTRL